MPTVYLAGQITTRDTGCTKWRDRAIEKLASTEIVAFDPMRGKRDLALKSTDGGLTHPDFDNGDMMKRDFLDVCRSDLILVNLHQYDPERPLEGTLFELGWAWERRKLVVAFYADHHYTIHPFFEQTITTFAPDLDAAIEKVVFLLKPTSPMI